MNVRVHFYSYYREKTGCEFADFEIPSPAQLGQLLEKVYVKFESLAPFRNSSLVAVGVDYQKNDYWLREGEEVALFPPVQGG